MAKRNGRDPMSAERKRRRSVKSFTCLGVAIAAIFGLLFADDTAAVHKYLNLVQPFFGAEDDSDETSQPLIEFLESHDWKAADAETQTALAESIEALGKLRSIKATHALFAYLDFPHPKFVIAKGVLRYGPSVERIYPAIKAMVSIGRPSFYSIIHDLARGRIGAGITSRNAIHVLIRIEGAYPHGRELLRTRLNLLLKTDPRPERRAVYESILRHLEDD